MEFLFDRLKEGDKVLDLGCGNGRFYDFFKKRKVDYVGIDNSERMIEIAKEKHPEARFGVSSGFETTFPDSYFETKCTVLPPCIIFLSAISVSIF